MKRHTGVDVAPLLGFLAIAVIWQICSWLVGNAQLLPSISHMATQSLPSLGVFSDGGQPGFLSAAKALAFHASITALRVVCGMCIGIPLGITAGLLVHYLRGSGAVSASTLVAARSIPLLALIPLFSFWFGASLVGIIGFIAFGIFVQVSSDTYEATANVSPSLPQQGTLLGARGVSIAWKIYLPAVREPISRSAEAAVLAGWALSLGAEYISATSGLGYIVYQSYLFTEMGKLAVLATVYMILGYASLTAARMLGSGLADVLEDMEEKGT